MADLLHMAEVAESVDVQDRRNRERWAASMARIKQRESMKPRAGTVF
jgi:hypothetical protein